MKNTFFFIIVIGVIIYLLRKGIDYGEKTGKNLNFIESLRKGLQITILSLASSEEPNMENTFSDEPGYVDEKPGNPEMVNFTNQFSSFPGARLKKQRGVFHLPTIYRGN